MTAPDTVRDGVVVLFRYTLTDDFGTELDSSGEASMPYLHGAQNIVPGLERQMLGHKVGDSFKATVMPAEGYGEREDAGMMTVPRDAFPDDMEIEAGMSFVMEGENGEEVPVWVAQVDPDAVVIDQNHPLAGQRLHFAISITGLREATADEKLHGHPHGPDGTHSHGH